MDRLLLIAQLVTMSVGVTTALIAVLNGRAHGWRSVRGLALTATVCLVITGSLEWSVMRKYDAFLTLSSRLAERRGRCPASLLDDAATRPVAERLSLSVDAEKNWIVWRGFSLRRYATYDCATGDYNVR